MVSSISNRGSPLAAPVDRTRLWSTRVVMPSKTKRVPLRSGGGSRVAASGGDVRCADSGGKEDEEQGSSRRPAPAPPEPKATPPERSDSPSGKAATPSAASRLKPP